MSEGRNPQEVLGEIFSEFSHRRKQEKVAAWIFLQSALAEHASVICPSVVSLKDLIAAVANVEDLLKGASANTGESPVDYLERFLNGDKTVTQ